MARRLDERGARHLAREIDRLEREIGEEYRRFGRLRDQKNRLGHETRVRCTSLSCFRSGAGKALARLNVVAAQMALVQTRLLALLAQQQAPNTAFDCLDGDEAYMHGRRTLAEPGDPNQTGCLEAELGDVPYQAFELSAGQGKQRAKVGLGLGLGIRD